MVNINISIHVNIKIDYNNKYLNLLRRLIINHAIILHQHMIKMLNLLRRLAPSFPRRGRAIKLQDDHCVAEDHQ